MDVPGLSASLRAPAHLLVREARHWLPTVIALAMISALPTVVVRTYAPAAFAAAGGLAELDGDLLMAGLLLVALLMLLKLTIELVAYMLVFVVLADLTAGRPPALGQGLRRLASWRLQGVWILAGLFEQAAIDFWFVGAGLLLIPFGLVTVAAYEEDNGLKAVNRSFELGKLDIGGPKPGLRIAVGVTAGFAVAALASVLLAAISFLLFGNPLLAIVFALLDGTIPPGGFSLPPFGWADAAGTLLLAPLGLLPTVYMMATQQSVYWEARRFEETRLERTG